MYDGIFDKYSFVYLYLWFPLCVLNCIYIYVYIYINQLAKNKKNCIGGYPYSFWYMVYIPV